LDLALSYRPPEPPFCGKLNAHNFFSISIGSDSAQKTHKYQQVADVIDRTIMMLLDLLFMLQVIKIDKSATP